MNNKLASKEKYFNSRAQSLTHQLSGSSSQASRIPPTNKNQAIYAQYGLMGHDKKDQTQPNILQKQGSFNNINNIRSGNSTSLFKYKNKKSTNRESSLQHVRPNQEGYMIREQGYMSKGGRSSAQISNKGPGSLPRDSNR